MAEAHNSSAAQNPYLSSQESSEIKTSELERLKTALADAKHRRTRAVQELKSSSDESEFLATITKFTKIHDGIRHMTEYLKEVDLELVKSDRFLGYGSIAAWAKATKEQMTEVSSMLTNICGLGAGFTYATIFSATRGSIGLMSWAFAFFILGLSLPICCQMVLAWMLAMPPETRLPAMKYWKILITAAMLFANFSADTAVFLLVVCLYNIQYSPIASGESAALVPTNSPQFAFWVAIAILSFIGLNGVMMHFLFIYGNDREILKGIYLARDRRGPTNDKALPNPAIDHA